MSASWGKGYLYSLKISLHKLFLTKGKNANFTVEKFGEHHVNQVIKGNVTVLVYFLK